MTTESMGQKTLSVTTVGGGTAQVVAVGRCRFNGILCQAETTGEVTVYDNATAASGTLVGYLASPTPIGTYYSVHIPCANGITIADAGVGGDVLTIVYTPW